MKNKIALIGLMGCGKSTISKILSKKINIKNFELDEIFEKKFNISIKEYFKINGEKQFRAEENIILSETTKNNNEFILSCGGGIILKKENRDILFSPEITTIYLKASVDELFNRLKNNSNRPLLQVENPKMELEKLLNSREIFYKQAKFEINANKKVEKIIDEIIAILN